MQHTAMREMQNCCALVVHSSKEGSKLMMQRAYTHASLHKLACSASLLS